MKMLAFLCLLGLAAVVAGCGSNTIASVPNSTVNGNWEAELFEGAGPAAGPSLNFMANFNLSTTNGNGTEGVNVPYFAFLNSNSCFPTGAARITSNAQLTNSTNTGQITGSITFSITSGTGNVLMLSAVPPAGEIIGTSSNNVMTNGAVNGQWWLTPGNGPSDSLCTAGSASSPLPFIMCQNAAKCTTAIGPSISGHKL